VGYIGSIYRTVAGAIGKILPDQEKEIAVLVKQFPDVFYRAVADWSRFKVGVKAGLFTAEERDQVVSWFEKFPDLWATVRPNFVMTRTSEGTFLPLGQPGFAEKVDKWVSVLPQETEEPGLGIAPIIVAGVIVAGALGIAGGLWAVAYIKKQANITRLIDETVTGRLPVAVLDSALQAETALLSPIAGLAGVVKWLALGVVAYLVVPVIAGAVRGKKKK
jgi:hypothetical protein